MKIYIADLAAYNAGNLAGKWLDLDNFADAEELKDAISDWLKERGIEEYAVHDYDDCPAQDMFGEYPDLDEIFTYHMLREEYGDSFVAWFDLFYFHGCPCDTWGDRYRDAYIGEYDTWSDFAYEWLHETGEIDQIPEHLQYYFDYSAYGQDVKTNGDICEQDGFFFWNH